jgi:hypothetical protein
VVLLLVVLAAALTVWRPLVARGEARRGEAMSQTGDPVIAGSKVEAKAEGGEAEACGNAAQGDPCYKEVVWAMNQGFKQHPEWYDGLTQDSLFEDFQEHIHRYDATKCPPACPSPSSCKTATAGPCFTAVHWAMTAGIVDHPEWYPGLASDSPLEKFQEHVHEYNSTLCPPPCNPQPFKALSLFCWSVVRSAEVALIRTQSEKSAGIFACNDYAIVSDQDLTFDGPRGPASALRISTTAASGWTKDGTSPNAPIFLNAWEQLRLDGRFQAHDYIVKLDPDTVFFPERLAAKLSPGGLPSNPYPPPYATPASSGVFVTNCDKMANWGAGWGNGWPMMYGSVEILSREALLTYFARLGECKGSMAWQGMAEDAFMGLCLRQLKVGELFIKQGDNACSGGACTDPSFAAFHPYKDPGTWANCWNQATR